MNIQILPTSITVLYLLLCIGIGIYAKRLEKSGTSHEYLTGGGGVGFWVNGFAIFAAFATGGTMMGNMGVSYAGGWGYIMAYNGGVAVGYVITVFYLAKIFRNMSVSTVPEFIKVRFNSKLLNIVIPIVLILTLGAYVVAQMKIGGLIGERLLGIPYTWSVVIIGIVYIFYTAYGGMKAVTLTDFFQGLLMIGVVIVTGIIALMYGSGPIDLYSAAQAIKPSWTTSETYPYIAYLGAFIVWATAVTVLPHTVMRIFAAKDEKTGRASLTLGLGLYIVTCVVTLILVVGSTMVVTGGIALPDADTAFLVFLEELTPSWIEGIAFAAIFAAVMSSVSAMLLALGAAFAYDLIGTVKPDYPEEKKRKLVPISIVVFGIITMLFAFNPPALLSLLYSAAMGLLASTLFFPLLLGVWWKRMNKEGALAAALSGAISYLILFFAFDLPALSEIVYALPISLVFAVGVTLLTPEPTEKELRRMTIAHQREFLPEDIEPVEPV
ncbi:sodium:solute symporter [Planococcus sp. NCCP-2050]|uniref:sodium:solute symporter family protein n=1 Tax=Planococcus sp. NCCP-2050 TaxID=2944679 RepID=UPI0020421FED|nr:sodium:solute symporter family protein [Planococcus sp. NCCP-2050]GKW45914.1 osmoregulated proline transporter OpuE [Planococcus sp. NCCP-2050]